MDKLKRALGSQPVEQTQSEENLFTEVKYQKKGGLLISDSPTDFRQYRFRYAEVNDEKVLCSITQVLTF